MYVLTYDYNQTYSPSAPFVEIEVNNHIETASPLILTAQVDSAADATMIPLWRLRRIGARHAEKRRMLDVSGLSRWVDLYHVMITLASQRFFVRVIGLKNVEEAIIGRDILNHLVVTLNGPAATTLIEVDEWT